MANREQLSFFEDWVNGIKNDLANVNDRLLALKHNESMTWQNEVIALQNNVLASLFLAKNIKDKLQNEFVSLGNEK